MSKENKIQYRISGLPLVVTMVSLIFYSCITFFGLNYTLEGYEISIIPDYIPRYLLSAVVVVLLNVIAFLCLQNMCRGKVDRSRRRGRRREISSGFVVMLILILESVPFMKFLYVYDHETELVGDVFKMRNKTIGIFASYEDYVDKRLESASSTYDLFKYRQIWKNGVINSLKRRLMPVNLKSIAERRRDWLEGFDNVSIWNFATPHNIMFVMKAASVWVEEYKRLSNFAYEHEAEYNERGYSAFSSPTTLTLYNKWTERMKKIEIPDYRMIIIFFVVVLFIMVSYLSAKRRRNRLEIL